MLLTLESLYEPITPGQPEVVDPYQAFLVAATSFSRVAPQGTATRTVYATFDEDTRQMPIFVDTDLIYPGENGLIGSPAQMRYFDQVRFGGAGTLFVRAMVDQEVVQEGFVVLAEDPNQASCFNLPRGTAGYGLRLQFVGVAWWRFFFIDWDPVGGEERR